jgi:hypothetical protein
MMEEVRGGVSVNKKESTNKAWVLGSVDWLIDWLYTVLRPAQEFFTYM